METLLTSVAKAAPTMDIDPMNNPAICIHILHCPYAVKTLSSALNHYPTCCTHGPDNAATIYDNPVCKVAASVIVPVPLPGNSSSVQYACKTPIENGIPQIRTSIAVAPIRNNQAALPPSAGGRDDAFSGAVRSTSNSGGLGRLLRFSRGIEGVD
jgi:hypothetical protein